VALLAVGILRTFSNISQTNKNSARPAKTDLYMKFRADVCAVVGDGQAALAACAIDVLEQPPSSLVKMFGFYMKDASQKLRSNF
jgi:hypothetical protein